MSSIIVHLKPNNHDSLPFTYQIFWVCFHLVDIYINTFLQIHSDSWLAKVCAPPIASIKQQPIVSRTKCASKRTRMNEMNEWINERERGRTSDWRSYCHEQFHANRFIKLGSKTNFKMRLRTISKHHLNFGKLVKVYNSWKRKSQTENFARAHTHSHTKGWTKHSNNNDADLSANTNVSVSYVYRYMMSWWCIHHKRGWGLDLRKIGWHHFWISNSSD